MSWASNSSINWHSCPLPSPFPTPLQDDMRFYTLLKLVFEYWSRMGCSRYSLWPMMKNLLIIFFLIVFAIFMCTNLQSGARYPGIKTNECDLNNCMGYVIEMFEPNKCNGSQKSHGFELLIILPVIAQWDDHIFGSYA